MQQCEAQRQLQKRKYQTKRKERKVTYFVISSSLPEVSEKANFLKATKEKGNTKEDRIMRENAHYRAMRKSVQKNMFEADRE